MNDTIKNFNPHHDPGSGKFTTKSSKSKKGKDYNQLEIAKSKNSIIIKRSETIKPKTKEEIAIDGLKDNIEKQALDYKDLIKHLNDLVPNLISSFETIPQEVLKAFANKLEFSVSQQVTLEDGQEVKITNLEQLAKAINVLSSEFIKYQSKDEIKISNIENAKTDMSSVIQTLSEFEKLVKEFIKKDVNVIVNTPEEITIRNWPSKPKEAIPVVLVNKEFKDFYDAMLSVAGMGGGNGPLMFKDTDGGSLVEVSLENPLPVNATLNIGDIEIGAIEIKDKDSNDRVEVNERTDGIYAMEVNDDFTSFEANHQTLVSSTDTMITFAQTVRMIQISNWDTINRILVKDGSITSDSDSTAARVGKAPAADIPGKSTFVFKTANIHLRSAANSEVTITAYF